MSKLTNPQSDATPTVGWIAAVALACTLAVAGCSTYDVDNPGVGEPARSGAGAGPTVPSSTPGTYYGGGGGNVPMISSYSAVQPVVIAANRAQFLTKYLGPAAPDSKPSAVQLNQAPAPAQVAVPVFIGDDAEFFGGAVGPTTTGAVTGATTAVTSGTTPVTTAGVTTAGTIAGTPVSISAGLAASAAAAPIATPATAASTLTLSPTVTSAGTASPTISSATVNSPAVFSTAVPSPTVASAVVNPSNTGVVSTTTPSPTAVAATPGSIAVGTGMAGVTSGLSTPVASSTLSGMTTARRRAAASTPTTATVSRQRIVSPTLGRTTPSPRIRIVQGANGEVMVTNQ